MSKTVLDKMKIIYEILTLPKVHISLKGHEDFFHYFTQRHTKYFFIRKKTLGVALLPIINTYEDYLESINGKNSAAYYTRKAERKGYVLQEIDPNNYLNDIYEINISKEYRQGRKMSESYLKKLENMELKVSQKYFGILNYENKLVAYAWVPVPSEVWILSTLLGHASYLNDGIMYMLVTGIVKKIFYEETKPRYLMYDTYHGAKDGLRMFKDKLGFKRYKVSWSL